MTNECRHGLPHHDLCDACSDDLREYHHVCDACSDDLREYHHVPAKVVERAILESGRVVPDPEVEALREQLAKEQAIREALQAFKDYVHQRLDAMNVPTHPNGEHSKAGCRVGDRLDVVQAKLEAAERDAERYRWFRTHENWRDGGPYDHLYEDELDAAVDAALKGER